VNKQEAYRIVISGGGTGGHIYPAIAIANTFQGRYENAEILFVGAKGKMEMQKVPEAGYKIIGLWISGLQRKITLSNLIFPLKVISSIFRSFSILRSFKPHVVVGVGGYASGPMLYSATRKKIPSLIQEQNSYAGLTNKLLAKKVRKVCVAYHGMDKYFMKEKIVFTGNPVRNDIQNITEKKEQAVMHFGIRNDRKTILVLGGSLGARSINEAVLANIDFINNTECQVIWQCGSYYYEEMKERLASSQSVNVWLHQFVREMDLAYAAADVVISRAGALSISELCLVRKPVIFVPSPNVAEDHQTKNAMALVSHEAAIMIRDKEASEKMVREAMELLYDENKKEMLARNIGKLGKPEAAYDIVNEIIKLIA
jgi:UDP-N-acetylglucosamine--N-acetylmuramyl-(pentapeptide) pyrophosphoryl-undecaprenol N-acetylglucosamine transferase